MQVVTRGFLLYSQSWAKTAPMLFQKPRKPFESGRTEKCGQDNQVIRVTVPPFK